MVVARVPRWEEAHLLLQMSYAQTDRMPEAIKECERVAFDPEHYGTNLLLRRVLELAGKPAAALPRLKKAAVIDPKAPRAAHVSGRSLWPVGSEDGCRPGARCREAPGSTRLGVRSRSGRASYYCCRVPATIVLLSVSRNMSCLPAFTITILIFIADCPWGVKVAVPVQLELI